MLRTALLLFIAVATDLSFAAQPPGTMAEAFASDAEKLDLIEKISQPWNTANQWLIEYDFVAHSDPTNTFVRNIMAVGAPGDYYKLKAHEGVTFPWQFDPFAVESFIHDGVRYGRWPFRRSFNELLLKPGDELSGSLPYDILWRVIPACPMTLYRLPDLDTPKTSPVLGRSLRSEHCRLLSGSEVINGESCRVFFSDDGNASKKTWIATNLGLCLMKEEIRYIPSKELVQRILTDKIGTVAPRFSMPTDYRVQWFLGDGSEEVIAETRVHVRRCLFNDDVPASTFVITNAAGSIKDNHEKDFTQVIPGGQDLLLDIVRFMTEASHLPTKAVSSAKVYVWALPGLICGFGLGLLVFPLKRQVSKPVDVANQVNGKTS